MIAANQIAIRRALETARVEFIDAKWAGPGRQIAKKSTNRENRGRHAGRWLAQRLQGRDGTDTVLASEFARLPSRRVDGNDRLIWNLQLEH
jgi:hypothetical protein